MVGFAWRNRTDFTTAHRILQLPVGSRAFINNCRTEHFQIGLEAGKATRPDEACRDGTYYTQRAASPAASSMVRAVQYCATVTKLAISKFIT